MKTTEFQQSLRLLTFFMAAIFIVLPASAVEAPDTVLIDGVYYLPSSTGNTACVFGNTVEDVVIKPQIEIDGKSYTVDVIGTNQFGFEGFDSTTRTISIPSSINSIRANSFEKCPNLVSISSESPEFVVRDKALYNKDYTQIFVVCKDIESFVIPETVTRINYGLYDCAKLTEIRLPNSLSLQYGAYPVVDGTDIAYAYAYFNDFVGCSCLKEIIVDEDNPKYSVKDGVLFNKDFTHLIAVPADRENIDIPSSVSVISFQAFMTCSKITRVEMPEGIYAILARAFAKSGLTEINVPNTVQWWYGEVCSDCTELEKVVFSANVKVIQADSFIRCSKLRTVYLGENVTRISYSAFALDNQITSIYSANPVPPEVSVGGFNGVPRTATVYVPMESVEAYKNASVWKEFNIVGYDFDKIEATGIELDKTSLTLVEGSSEKLTVIITPDDTTDKGVVWTSSDANVATVDQEGNVTAVSEGEAIITATTTDGSNLSATCNVTVTIQTGIDGVETDGDTTAEIYTSDGVKVFSGRISEWTGSPKGIYIVRMAGKTAKTVVR